jgi:cell division protein FtsZ
MHDGPLADLFRATDAARETRDAEAAAAAPEAAPELPLGEEPRARPPRRRSTPQGDATPQPVPLSPGADTAAYLAVIRVVGVGGAGVNAINRMIEAGIRGVEFVAVNTDAQQLQLSEAPVRVHIGRKLTSGLGSGSAPEVGRRAAEEADEEIRRALRGSDLVFVAAGEGGGTGTGAAPVVARIARELGALTVGIVTTPFAFEGKRRSEQSEDGMARLSANVDTLVAIPNERLLQIVDRRTSVVEAFRVADDILRQGVQGITDLITTPGLINLDFADVRTIMKGAGSALMGIGMASGPNRAQDAARKAVTSPLVGRDIRGATGILLSVSGGSSLSLHDAGEIADVIREAADPDCNIIFGATVDESLGDQVWVTVIATGFDASVAVAEPRASREAARPAAAPEEPAFEFRLPPATSDPGGDDGLEIPDFLRKS